MRTFIVLTGQYLLFVMAVLFTLSLLGARFFSFAPLLVVELSAIIALIAALLDTVTGKRP